MKCIWEEKDIRPGLFIARGESSDAQSKPSNVFQIAWTAVGGNLTNSYGLASVLIDGMLQLVGSKLDLVNYLNTPHTNYRPVSKKELLAIIGKHYEGLF